MAGRKFGMKFPGNNYRNGRDINLETLGAGLEGQRFHSTQGWIKSFRSLKPLKILQHIMLYVFLMEFTLRDKSPMKCSCPQTLSLNPIKPLELTPSLPERQTRKLTPGGGQSDTFGRWDIFCDK